MTKNPTDCIEKGVGEQHFARDRPTQARPEEVEYNLFESKLSNSEFENTRLNH